MSRTVGETRPYAGADVGHDPRAQLPYVTFVAFHERDYSHLGILAVGHAGGFVALYTW